LRKTLAREVADQVLNRIIDGEFPVGTGLPSEAELGEGYDVSRITVREAVKSLQAQGVIDVRSGKGSFVNPPDEWSSLDAVLRFTARESGADDVAVQLVEVRRMFETGATALAATRRTQHDLDDLRRYLAQMRSAHETDDLNAFVAADLAFHDVILKASGNVFVGVLFQPLTRVLTERRRETSRVPDIQRHAIAEHANILAALTSGNPETARAAMDSHMTQTVEDLKTYVLKPVVSAEGPAQLAASRSR
jgi:GntR family transcriptional repressor for pyruvate dehydrogenase complex